MYALTLLLAVVFMNLYSNIRPYKDEHDNRLQSCCLTSIALVAFCALAAKVAEELDDKVAEELDDWNNISLQVTDLWTLVAILNSLLLVSNSSAASVWGCADTDSSVLITDYVAVDGCTDTDTDYML
jgi:hypothetical protein